jgi:hypothetical protein
VFLFDLGTQSDLIVVTGAFLFGDNKLGLGDFGFTIGEGFGEGVYTLVTTGSEGSFVGSFGTELTGIVGGREATLEFNLAGNAIQLSVGSAIPEPATLAGLMGGLVLGVVLTRRRVRRT